MSIINPVISDDKLTIIAGPCVIESYELLSQVAEQLLEIKSKYDVNIVFKSSFDKANRTSINSFRSLGYDKAIAMLAKIKNTYNLPVITDVHETYQVDMVSEVVDVIQIPAFLCRQTDLLLSVAKTGKWMNIKKGQFLSPADMVNVINKVSPITDKIMLCERGTFFGYNSLVVDMQSLPTMKEFGYPVIYDATHSVQKPGAGGDSSLGAREMVPYLARSAVACSVDGVFIETHPNPDKALSDGPNSWPLSSLDDLVGQLVRINQLVKEFKCEL